jgi:hypothetical protein
MGTSRGRVSDANGGGSPPRRYANHLAVDFSLSEFALSFGQQVADQAEPVIHSVVISSPVHMAVFCQEIRASLLRYESRFGPIPGSLGANGNQTRQ